MSHPYVSIGVHLADRSLGLKIVDRLDTTFTLPYYELQFGSVTFYVSPEQLREVADTLAQYATPVNDLTGLGGMSHTPGPWTVELYYPQHRAGFPACLGQDYDDSGDMPTEDDARLIAAAPDLLAALKDCRGELFKRIDVLTARMSDEIRQVYLDFLPIVKADMAIAKAEGHTP